MSLFLVAVLLLGRAAGAGEYRQLPNRSGECAENRLTLNLGRRSLPDCSYRRQANGKEFEVRFNRLGLRDRDYPARPPRGTLRILALGDSLLVNDELPEEQSIPRLLEGLLRKAGWKLELINGGMISYNSFQILVAAPELLRSYAPHLVVFIASPLVVPFSDAANERYYFPDASGAPLSYFRNPIPRLPRWLQAPAYSCGRCYPWIVTFFELIDRYRASREADPRKFLSASVRAAAALRRESEKSGADFLYAVEEAGSARNSQNHLNLMIPAVSDWAYRWWIPRRKIPLSILRELLETERIPVLAISPPPYEPEGKPGGELHRGESENLAYAEALARSLLVDTRLGELRKKL